MLEIKNLHASVDDEEILRGIDLQIPKGEVHAIMGPNGSGKSTLAYVLAGKDDYEITQGSINWDGTDLSELSIDERVVAGFFLANAIPGRNSRRWLNDLFAHGDKCGSQGARPERIKCRRVHAADPRKSRRIADPHGHAQTPVKCRLFRRRKETRRNPANDTSRSIPHRIG